MEGTYALPEAQRDRFMARISMGYPDAKAEAAMLRAREDHSPLDDVAPVVDTAGFLRMVDTVRGVFVSPAVEQYMVAIAQATRNDTDLRLGASPRATLHLMAAAKARAALEGREFVLPDDVNALVRPVLSHRVVVAARANGALTQAGADEVIGRIVDSVPVPLGAVENR